MIGLQFEVGSVYIVVLLGLLTYGARSVPIFVFARTRGLPHSWLALFAGLDLFVLAACVGVPRRTILCFAAITGALAVGVLVLIVATGPTSTGLDHSIMFGPDVVAMFLWMAACRDTAIPRGWGFLAAWPVVGGLGAWRIVLEVKQRLSPAPRFA